MDRFDDEHLLALDFLDVLGLVFVSVELEHVERVCVHPVRHVCFGYDLLVHFFAVHAESFRRDQCEEGVVPRAQDSAEQAAAEQAARGLRAFAFFARQLAFIT